MLEIEKDLIRWPRAQWVTVVIAILVLQSLLLFSASRTPDKASNPPRQEPTVSFSAGGSSEVEPVFFEEPTLFASANPHGFSGSAWLEKAPWSPPLESSLGEREFLTFAEAVGTRRSEVQRELPGPTHKRPKAAPSNPAMVASVPEQKSRLIVEELPERQLLSDPKLPIQFSTDAVRASIVQILVGSDGLVLSSRILRSSGSKTADLDAVTFARKARFNAIGNFGTSRSEEIAIGTLVFEWFARDVSQTNSIPSR